MNHVVIAKVHVVDMLEELIGEEGKVIILSKSDGDYTGNAGVKHSTSPTLEGCIERLTKRPRMKICLREDCISAGIPKPLDCFTPDKDSHDGHAGVCKSCEAKRVGGIGKRKKNSRDGNQVPPKDEGNTSKEK